MQLTRYTDFGLRVMMYLTQAGARETPVTVAEIAERFAVSRHHIVKVVHFLARQEWIVTTRGKGGGLRLARAPSTYRLGDLVQTLERQHQLVNCVEPPCALAGVCLLASALDKGLRAFFETLNQQTLADVVRTPTAEAIVRLHRAA